MNVRMLMGAMLLAATVIAGAGCAIVPQNRRAKLADPLMQFSVDPLETRARQKLYSSREGAAGGDGESAGGGCGCQ